MTRFSLRLGAAAGLLALAGVSPSALAAHYVPPPQMPAPNTWEGRDEATVQLLDKLDADVRTVTVKVGADLSFKNLTITVRACLDHPPGVPEDNTAFLAIQDKRGTTPAFGGWMFSGEPSIGVYESPVYAVQLVSCGGQLVAPMAPPLPPLPQPPADLVPPSAGGNGEAPGLAPPAPPPAANPGVPGQVPPAPPTPAGNAPVGSATSVDGEAPPPPAGSSVDGAPARPAPPSGGDQESGQDGDQPDPVYPSGPPH